MTTIDSASDGELEAARYLRAVESRLSGLPASERAELLEDLSGHLEELTTEGGRSLTEQIGSPEAYADELLASLGVTEAPLRLNRRASLARGVRRSRAAQWLGQRLSSPLGEEARSLWMALRPAWWVARAYLAVSLLATVSDRGHFPGFPVPGLFNNVGLGLVAILVAVVASVRLGQKGPTGMVGMLMVAANLALIVFGGVLVGRLGSGSRVLSTAPSEAAFHAYAGQPCLTNGNGEIVTNLYPYSADGKLTPVLLYDQSGHPVDNLCPTVDDQGRPLTTQYGKDANGAPVYNLFPRQQSVQILPAQVPIPAFPGSVEKGAVPQAPLPSPVTSPVAPPAIVVPQLATPTPSATATPTPSSSPASASPVPTPTPSP